MGLENITTICLTKNVNRLSHGSYGFVATLCPLNFWCAEPERLLCALPFNVEFWKPAQLTVSVAGLVRGRPALPEHLTNSTIASFVNVAGQWLISGAAYAVVRSLPHATQEALAPEAATHKFTRGPITLEAHNMRLACQDCQYNDLGVSAGRIAVMREKTLNVERPDGSTELQPAFAQVAVFYVSDPAEENVLKVQGRLQPQNIATDDEESSYDVMVALTQSVQSPQGRDAPAITKFFLAQQQVFFARVQGVIDVVGKKKCN